MTRIKLQAVVDAAASAGKISPLHGNCKVKRNHKDIWLAAEAASEAGWKMSKLKKKARRYHIGTGCYMAKGRKTSTKKVKKILMGKEGPVTWGFVLNFKEGKKFVRDWSTFRQCGQCGEGPTAGQRRG